MEEWWWLVLEVGAEDVGSGDVAAECRVCMRCCVRAVEYGLVCVRWSMDGRGPDRCMVVYVMCVEQEEARQSLKLLQVLPGDVNAELIELCL